MRGTTKIFLVDFNRIKYRSSIVVFSKLEVNCIVTDQNYQTLQNYFATQIQRNYAEMDSCESYIGIHCIHKMFWEKSQVIRCTEESNTFFIETFYIYDIYIYIFQLNSTQRCLFYINIHCWSLQHRTETSTGLFVPLLLSSYT